MSQNMSVKTNVAIGIGAALFVVLGRFAAVPSGIPNTTIELTYPFLALMAVVFGPVAGLLIGFIGHAVKDMMMYGGPWWSWVICSGIVGAFYGITSKKIIQKQGAFSRSEIIYFNIVQIIANVVVWGLLAPTLDIVIYSEPANKVYTQGFVAAGLNSVGVGVVGTILIAAYISRKPKKGSLSKE